MGPALFDLKIARNAFLSAKLLKKLYLKDFFRGIDEF
jgi:hypothetical protein